ncbi:hypothetical protein [Paraburkholderia caledonica]|uniref:hypothetical protein n=1 Tax=Paraburkholderia caledonica TaxID=134536 RepID=UPI0006944CD3
MVELLSLAHERACEAQLAQALVQYLADGQPPDLDELRWRFAPDPATVSQVHVRLASLRDYEALLHLDMEDDIMSNDIDATRLSLLLNDLRLPAVKQIWPSFAERSDKEGWPAARLRLRASINVGIINLAATFSSCLSRVSRPDRCAIVRNGCKQLTRMDRIPGRPSIFDLLFSHKIRGTASLFEGLCDA